jgi:hypothetical protein
MFSAKRLYNSIINIVRIGSGAALLLAGLAAGPAAAQPVQNPGANGTVDTWASGPGADGHCIYHPQVTAYFCGAATMEMELDCTAVRSQNAVIDTCLGAGVRGANPGAAAVDGAPQVCFPMQFNWPPIVYNANNIVVSGFQTYCYGLVHGLNTYNGLTYNNPFYGPGLGTSLDDMAAGLNLMDSPANLAGPHNYISYNILNPDWANRTMADALWQLGIPAAATVMHGAHWVSVVGVETDVNPVANGRFTIYGFFVQDPWTGYQQANPFGPNGQLLPPGLAENKFCSTRVNPNRAANDQLWSELFNPAGGPPLPLYGSGVGYKFEVEPVGPLALDTGNNGEYSSVPAPSAILANAPITAAEALVIATNDLTADAFLNQQEGFTDGGWDLANATLIQYPTDGPNEGDWLLPYEGPGGTNDVTGFVLIDVETGDLDEAVWMNPGDVVSSMSLTNVETLETDEFLEIVPDDNAGEPQLSIQSTGTNTVVLTWPTTFLTSYAVEQTTSLAPANWVTVPVTTTTNLAGEIQAVVPVTPGQSQSFYRLVDGPVAITPITGPGGGKLPSAVTQ